MLRACGAAWMSVPRGRDYSRVPPAACIHQAMRSNVKDALVDRVLGFSVTGVCKVKASIKTFTHSENRAHFNEVKS